MNQLPKRMAAPKEYRRAESGTVSRKRGYEQPWQTWNSSPEVLCPAGRASGLLVACHQHALGTWYGAGAGGSPVEPPHWEAARLPGKGKDRAPGSPPRSKDIIWGKAVPVYQDQSHGAFVYRAVCWTTGMRPGRPSEFTNMGQHNVWHWEVTSKCRDNF